MNSEAIAHALGGAKPKPGGGWMAICPAHDDKNSSLSLDDEGERVLWRCFAGCAQAAVTDALKARDCLPTTREAPEDAWRRWCRARSLSPDLIRAAYGVELTTTGGRPVAVFSVDEGPRRVRFLDAREPKTRWESSRRNVSLDVMYAAHHDGPIYVVNGEPSVWACHQSGVAAVCTCTGEGSLPSARAIAWLLGLGRELRIVYDLDIAGIAGAKKLRSALPGSTAYALPDDLGPGGDVDDLHRRLGDFLLADALDNLEVLGSVPPRIHEPAVLPAPTRRQVVLINRQPHEVLATSAKIWEAEVKRRVEALDRPFMRRLGVLVSLSDGALRSATQAGVMRALSDAADWGKERAGENGGPVKYVPQWPPPQVIADLLDDPRAPEVRGVANTPRFGAAGDILQSPGYHATDLLWMHDPLKIGPLVPVDQAVAVLLEAVHDFPFVADADRANAIGLFILPFVRAMIDGATPLHLISASVAGTGKSRLANLAAIIDTGCSERFKRPAQGRDAEQEWSKILTSYIGEGDTRIVFDNLSEHFETDSPSLASAITSRVYQGRRLGASESIRATVDCIWVATGNNPRLSAELADRSCPIRLDAGIESPRLRTGFLHCDLEVWAMANRDMLVNACLSLIAAWIAADRPKGPVRIGSFEAWSETISGILVTAGVPGFMANRQESLMAADQEGEDWRAFVSAWWTAHECAWVAVKDLVRIANDMTVFKGDENSAQSIGMALQRTKGAIFSGHKWERMKRNTGNVWRLVKVTGIVQ